MTVINFESYKCKRSNRKRCLYIQNSSINGSGTSLKTMLVPQHSQNVLT